MNLTKLHLENSLRKTLGQHQQIESRVIRPFEPLNQRGLKAAQAAFMNVPAEAIRLEHEIGAFRKSMARAIRAYIEESGR